MIVQTRNYIFIKLPSANNPIKAGYANLGINCRSFRQQGLLVSEITTH